MSKITFFLHSEKMKWDAQQAAEREALEDYSIELSNSENVVEAARKAVAEGTGMIISRGALAALIRQNIDVPLVEIRMTGQEIALLIVRAKSLLRIAHPAIAFIGFEHTFCDMSYMSNIFDADIRFYCVESSGDIAKKVDQAAGEHADIIIGGLSSLDRARAIGLPGLFLESTPDSMREAVREAMRESKNMLWAIRQEKKHTAQLQTVLDYSSNGVLRVDNQGKVLFANHVIKLLAGRRADSICGEDIANLIPGLTMDKLAKVLAGGEEMCTLLIELGGTQLIANVVPIIVEGVSEGAIVSCHELEQLTKMESTVHKKLYESSGRADASFDMIVSKSAKMQRCIENAKLFACSNSPVLIYVGCGGEDELMARSLHNESNRREYPFYVMQCSAYSAEMQRRLLFGNTFEEGVGPGLLHAVNQGTLFLRDIDKLDLTVQHRLLSVIKSHTYLLLQKQSGEVETESFKARIFASSARDLSTLVQEGVFCKELYYLLCVFTVEIPPLQERPEDCSQLIENFIGKYSQKYSKFIVLTSGARHAVTSYHWDGNVLQLENFIEHIVLSAKHRSVDELTVTQLLNRLFPAHKASGQRIMVLKDPYAVRLAETLDKYEGNRDLVAKELGVSKSTLWRHMKRYGVSNKFSHG